MSPRVRSERTVRKERLYGPPLEGPGMELPACDAWPRGVPVRVGTSGWSYRHWQGRLYPRGLPSTQALAHFARRFPTVEVNSTYYRLPPERVFEAWRDATPPGFTFTVKAPGAITHDSRLVDVAWATEEFLQRCRLLRDRLGGVLFQLPPGFRADLPLLQRFLDLLPRDLRVAMELRHRSWFERDVRDLLSERNVAFVVHDYDRKGSPLWVTSDLAYLRLHGPTGRYRGAYDAETLLAWAEQVRAWRETGLDVVVYFNNDERGKSVRNAVELIEMLREPVIAATALHGSRNASPMAKSAYSSSARRTISKHVRKHRKEGMPQDQAVAAAMSEARRSGKKAPSRRKGKSKKANRPRKGTKTAKKRQAAKAGRKGGKATARKRARKSR